MRSILKIAFVAALFCSFYMESGAQISAVTSDGKKVILNADGTWRYIFENDGRKIILNPDGTWKYDTAKDVSLNVLKHIRADSSKVATVDSVKIAPVKVPVKVPLNLDCSYLVGVERDVAANKFAAESRKVGVFDNPKAGFAILFRKTKNTPLQWIITVSGNNQCIDEECKMNIVFKDGSRIQIPNDGKANCNGTFALYFGGVYGKEEILESLQNKEVAGVRIWTTKSFVDGNFTEDNSTLLKATVNCITGLK